MAEYILVEKPTSMNTEELLHFTVPQPDAKGKDVVVVSGYAHYARGWPSSLRGTDEHDYENVYYELQLFVGPRWRALHDVSPTAFVSESHTGDIKDAEGIGVESCTWEWVTGPDNPKHQIRLIIRCHVAGGSDAFIEAIGYHLTARGDVLSTDFKEIP